MKNKYFVTEMCLVLLILGGISSASAALYPAPEVNGPASNPAFPAGFEAFNPPVTNVSPVANAPEIAEWTRSNKPGDTMALTGEKLSVHSAVAEGRDTRYLFYSESAGFDDGLIQRLDGQQCALTLPSSLGANEMYLMWPRNQNGYGKPIAINQTESWWMTDRAPEQGTFSIYGRNLKLGNNNAYAYCLERDEWLMSSSSNPYKADFAVPGSWPEGTYTIYAHNGFGREYGFGDPQTLTVYSPIDWNAGTIRNVKDYGASGTGSENDYSAIQNTINACSFGDTVYFPNGTYAIGSTLTCNKSGIRFLGQSTAGVTVTSHSVFSGNNLFSSSNRSDMRFEKLTFDSGVYMDDITPFFTMWSADRVIFDSVVFTVEKHPIHTFDTYNGLEMYDSTYLTFTNCTFVMGSTFNLTYNDQLVFTDCDFYGVNDCWLFINNGKSEDTSVTGCTLQNYDNSDENDNHGWGVGRFYHCNLRNGRTANVYFGDNKTIDMTVRDGYSDQNQGEHYLLDVSTTAFRGSPVSATANTAVCSGLTNSYDRMSLAIVGGKGYGQVRDVVSVNASTGTITVDKDWNVVPDTTSIIVIGTWANRHVIYRNSFDGTEKGFTDGSKATCGIMIYGDGTHIVAESNTLHQLRWGIKLAKLSSTFDSVVLDRPMMFNTFIGNSISRVQHGIQTELTSYGGTPSYFDHSILANMFRGNSISNTSQHAIWHRVVPWQPEMDKTPVNLSVYDSNRVEAWAKYCVDDASEKYHPVMNNAVYVGNTFVASSGTGIGIEPEHSVVFHKNKWIGFTTKYGGNPPGGQLDIPVRVSSLNVDSTTGKVPVLNVGTSPLSWSADSDSSWLKITQVSGSVADENTSGMLEFEVDSSIAPSEDAEAVITVLVDNEPKRQVTVEYAASSPPPPEGPPDPVLTGISISGLSSVDEQTTAQYSCTATYSDGTSAAVTPTWSEDSSYTTISVSGLLSAGNVTTDQSVTITASYGGQTDTHVVTVQFVAPTLTGIAISGPTSVDEETTAQYSCTATYSDGSSATVTPTWSENSSHATINAGGVLSASNVTSDQNVTVSASFGGQTDTHAVTIKYIAPVLTGIAVSGPTSVNEQTTAQYTCTATYSDGTSATVTPTWSENSSYTAINASGLLSAGNVTSDQNIAITASYGGQSDTHAVTILYVAPTLTGLTISGPGNIDEETSAQFTCTAIWSDGTTAAVTPTWSENSSYTTISASGLLTAGNVTVDQNATVTASYGGLTATKGVAIKYIAPTVTGITISGPSSVDEETTAQYTCTANWSDGTTSTVTPAWSENSSYATISAGGLFTASAVDTDQNVVITATYGGQTDAHSLAIENIPPTLTGITISGPSSMDEETTAQYTCTASWSDGTTTTVTPVWSENSSYASINASGLLSAGNVSADQSVTVTASFDGESDTHAVTIKYVAPPVVLTGITVSGPSELDENSTVTFSCTANYSDGTTSPISPTWSEDSVISSISASGVLTVGNIDADATVTVSATYQGHTDTHVLSVWAVGTRIVYPLSGFDGKLVRGRLWDEVTKEYTYLGEMVNPDELVIENVNSNQWYWIVVEEFDESSNDWVRVQANWISM